MDVYRIKNSVIINLTVIIFIINKCVRERLFENMEVLIIQILQKYPHLHLNMQMNSIQSSLNKFHKITSNWPILYSLVHHQIIL